MTALIPADRNRLFRAVTALVGLVVVLGACTHDRALVASVPEDYTLRHPIAIQEANQTVVLFVGQAIAGPCGLWPEDLGPSIKNKSYFDNKQYYNFGCAYQRNMAAMVDNPSDLVQPRSETLAYTTRRTVAFEKYRKGTATTTIYPDADKAKLSDTGK